MQKKVLIALTNTDKLPGNGKPTGWHCSEVSHPLIRFRKADLVVDFVSPDGGLAPMDPASADENDLDNAAMIENEEDQHALANTRPPGEIDPDDYGAIYFAGGHGTMWDFPDADHLQALAAAIYENGGIVGAVCHGPAALVNLKTGGGSYLVDGKNIACFTNEEEHAVKMADVVPFLLADKLEARGAEHVFTDPFEPCVEVSDRLVTGQNPVSADGVADEMIRLLKSVS